MKRLGIHADLVYRFDGRAYSADRAFVKFVTALPPRVEEVVLFGRLDPERGRFPYELPPTGVRFVPLPHYPSVRAAGAVARALRASVGVVERELPSLDALWLFGPHPLGVAFARAARRRGVPVLLGVRQDLPAYVRPRTPWALPAVEVLERIWRRLARRAPAIVVGDDLARKYAGGAPVLSTGFSLISPAELVPLETALARDWSGPLRLLTVGRLSPEKNPTLLAEIVARLDERWRLEVVGEGPLRGVVEGQLRELGIADRVTLAGYVPNGPELWERYRAAHAFLHVSHTEGIPQVIFEAQASGLPVVATDVGGVRDAVRDTALLVPPDDAAAAASAVERLREDEELRRGLTERGLEHARENTLDAQLDKLAEFLRQQFG